MFGGGTTAHRHTRTILRTVTRTPSRMTSQLACSTHNIPWRRYFSHWYAWRHCYGRGITYNTTGKRYHSNDVLQTSLQFTLHVCLAKMYYKLLCCLLCTCVIGRTVHALDVITSISWYDSRSNLLHFFRVLNVSLLAPDRIPGETNKKGKSDLLCCRYELSSAASRRTQCFRLPATLQPLV